MPEIRGWTSTSRRWLRDVRQRLDRFPGRREPESGQRPVREQQPGQHECDRRGRIEPFEPR
jgi:hypothetical protein